MVSHSFRCDRNRLRLLLDDRVPEDRLADLARHVETCADCRRKLESLAAEAPWWSDVRQFLRPETSEESPTGEVGAGEPGFGGAAADAGGPPSRTPPLPFLATSDDPTQLGRLGPYEIVELIGSGGMGVVLKGFDRALNRCVAVKVLAPQLASSAAARRRFQREARAAAAIVHEHVVPIHAVDSSEGLPFLVMPFVRGKSLQERIDHTGPLELEEILRIGMQAASGLAAAHAQGLVHRDVKPANILLDNGVERVMITDFGLARAADDASLTQSGVVAGTPQYMAPEQAKGEPVDHRADLFSLGSVMYAMCTGHSPFRAETTMGVLRRICEDAPRPVPDVNPLVPAWLAEIIEKLLEKDPGKRFQSAAELADLLGRHLAHLQHPSAVPMPDRLRGRWRWSKCIRPARSKAAIAALGVVLVCGFAAAEILGFTRVAGFLADFGRRSPPGQAAESSTPADAQDMQTQSKAPEPTKIVVPSHLLPWDVGLQEQINDIRQEVDELEASHSRRSYPEQSPDPASDVDLQLLRLEQELDGTWP